MIFIKYCIVFKICVLPSSNKIYVDVDVHMHVFPLLCLNVAYKSIRRNIVITIVIGIDHQQCQLQVTVILSELTTIM